jgi:hypothetical protein
MPDATLAKKLRILPGNRLLLLHAPGGYPATLALPEDVTVATDPAGVYDVVQLFARTLADVDRDLPAAIAATKPRGMLWIAWPKKTAKLPTDLTRDTLWPHVHAAGWSGVTAISIDETWSALRFRPNDEVGR